MGQERRRTSTAIRRFKAWFGLLFLTIGLVGLFVGLMIFVVLGLLLDVGDLIWAFVAAPLVIGAAFSALGGTLLWLGLRQARTEERLRQHGTVTEATVSAIERTGARVNRRRLWHVRYTYTDLHGTVHNGESGYLNAEDAQSYRIGETVLVRYDPGSPATSGWIGREELPEQA